MFYEGNSIDSFPKNYQWSNATSITKGMAPWGAVALGEIDEIVQRLHQRASEPNAWWEEWCAMEKLKRFTLAGVAEKIECPLLITWGTEDKLTGREVADQLYAATGSRDKTLKIFDRETGGFEHCQADNRQVGIDYIADWLSARLQK